MFSDWMLQIWHKAVLAHPHHPGSEEIRGFRVPQPSFFGATFLHEMRSATVASPHGKELPA